MEFDFPPFFVQHMTCRYISQQEQSRIASNVASSLTSIIHTWFDYYKWLISYLNFPFFSSLSLILFFLCIYFVDLHYVETFKSQSRVKWRRQDDCLKYAKIPGNYILAKYNIPCKLVQIKAEIGNIFSFVWLGLTVGWVDFCVHTQVRTYTYKRARKMKKIQYILLM